MNDKSVSFCAPKAFLLGPIDRGGARGMHVTVPLNIVLIKTYAISKLLIFG